VVTWVKVGGTGAAKSGPTTQPASNVAAASAAPAARGGKGERGSMDTCTKIYYTVRYIIIRLTGL
jgi:hypothetical protein